MPSKIHEPGYPANSPDEDVFDTSEGAMAGAHMDVLNSTAQSQLKSVIDRVERLLVEKAEIMEQIKEVYLEAKGSGFDVKILRKVVKIRSMDRAKRQEEDAILDLYLSATGDL